MISKLRFSLIAVMMLVLLGFGFQDQAKGQVGLDGLFCPGVPDTTGWLETEIVGSGLVVPDFRGGLIGTVENSGADAVGGLDWQHVDNTFSNNLPPGAFGSVTPTNEVGSQLVTWWTQKDGRNTYLQVTNTNTSGILDVTDVEVHVRIHNEDCAEIRDFCDTYSIGDTHEYNLGDLVSNDGSPIPDGNLQGVEGWLVVTAVEDGTCGEPDEQAYNHNYLAGQLIIHDSDDYLYGVNTYARQAICETVELTGNVNVVPDGEFFEDPNLWTQQEAIAAVIEPTVQIQPLQLLPGLRPFAGLAASSADGSNSTYDGGSFSGISSTNLVNIIGSTDADVSILESAVIDVQTGSDVSYDFQLYLPAFTDANPMGAGNCANWAAVLLIRDIGGGAGDIVDGTCYQGLNVLGSDIGDINGTACTQLGTDDIASTSINNLEFFGGRSTFQVGETLSPTVPGNYRIQVVTGLTAVRGTGCTELFGDTGALISNVQKIEPRSTFEVCDGSLDGRANALLDRIDPTVLSAQFNILPGNVQAGADAVLINFADDYGNGPGNIGFGPYRPVAATSNYFITTWDEDELDISCGDFSACFARLGVDDALIPSEQFSPATPTPTPTVPPTATPTPTAPPTLIPTPTPNNGGSGSCAIAGSPVQLGTALANVLIPLVPVAFAFGVRAARRRKK